ncbi:hypothetical protein [Pseudoscardovia suis]
MSASAWLWCHTDALFSWGACCLGGRGVFVCVLVGVFVGVFEVGVVRRVVCFGAVFVNCGGFVKVCVFAISSHSGIV